MSTIKAVAARAGVSTATVSRALSSPGVVSPETRARVTEAVEALSYAPNVAARSLRTLRTSKILVMAPDIANPFFAEVLRGAEEAAQAAGYSILLGDTRNEPEQEAQYARMLLRKEADGLIFLGHRLPSPLTKLVQERGPRAPVVNGCDFSPSLGVSGAHIDNRAAAAEAMRLLYGLGHRRVGVICGPRESHIVRARETGVRECARAVGAERELAFAATDYSVEQGYREAQALLLPAERPTAIFCFSDELAVGALRAGRERGLRCPADLSIVGFDDVRYARFLDPALTTVRQPMARIGQATVRLLLAILAGAQTEAVDERLDYDLVVRGSTGPAPR